MKLVNLYKQVNEANKKKCGLVWDPDTGELTPSIKVPKGEIIVLQGCKKDE